MNPQIQPHSTHDTLTSACRVRPLGEEDVKQRVARSADFSVAIHQAEIAHVKQSRQAKLSFYVSEDEQYGDDKEEVVRGLYGMDGVDFKTTMDQLCELTAKGRDIHNSLYAVIEMPSNTPVVEVGGALKVLNLLIEYFLGPQEHPLIWADIDPELHQLPIERLAQTRQFIVEFVPGASRRYYYQDKRIVNIISQIGRGHAPTLSERWKAKAHWTRTFTNTLS